MESESCEIDLLESHIKLACLLEATARKPGNVHPGRSFADLSYEDFAASASLVAPILANAQHTGVGHSILKSAEATRDRVGRNTNLGILLLIAPLAAVPFSQTLVAGIGEVLDGLADINGVDAAHVFTAIGVAQPGGMGEVDDQDINTAPTLSLIECMQLAADRDTIASQYTNGFEQVLDAATELSNTWSEQSWEQSWEQSIIRLQLSLLATIPDTLIARKCGVQVAQDVSQRASEVLKLLPADFDALHPALLNFDQSLRLDGHRLNPGTTADMVAAVLFAALRERTITWSGKIDLAFVASDFATSANKLSEDE